MPDPDGLRERLLSTSNLIKAVVTGRERALENVVLDGIGHLLMEAADALAAKDAELAAMKAMQQYTLQQLETAEAEMEKLIVSFNGVVDGWKATAAELTAEREANNHFAVVMENRALTAEAELATLEAERDKLKAKLQRYEDIIGKLNEKP